MTSTEATPRYRNFSNNMPTSTNPTPRATSSLIAVEKEPERDPEEDCFMCRQAHVYVKPIGMQQERRVARRHPPPLTRAQIDELSRKKHLTKQEVRKLLQCYFPEIKDVKYFQLHKYHSCCYDPKHLNLCKNHITALQHERDQHPDHHHLNGNGTHEKHYKDYEREGAPQNKVSFVRIKIEPTKGIPTRFLGPTALPDSLAEMLIKQVSHFENKKTPASFHPNKSSQPYNVRRVDNPYGTDEDDDEDDDDDDDEGEEEDGSNDDEYNRPSHVQGKVMAETSTYHTNNKQGKLKIQSAPSNGEIVVEDLDQLNDLYVDRQHARDIDHRPQMFSKPLKKKKRKKGTQRKNLHRHHPPKLNHWELLALQQSKQETCNCRHHVMRLEADQITYDWCRCKDHQHRDLTDRHKSALPPITSEVRRHPTPPPPPPSRPSVPRKKPHPKPPKVQMKSVGIDASGPPTTEVALAYDPSAVDYDMIQEVIYYRTSSGRLIKPEITNAFSYDSMPPDMAINYQPPTSNKAEVLYMTPNGQYKTFEGGTKHRGKTIQHSSPTTSIVLSNPGSLYNGHAYLDPERSSSNNNGAHGTLPVLKLPPSLASSRHPSRNNDNNEHQPTEFTLAKFSPDKSIGSPSSRHSVGSDTQGRFRHIPTQKSSKPTYSNLEPTPDYGRESSVVANRRWFDQPLGDQNLRPVHDGKYGLIAGTSTEDYQAKSQLPDDDYIEPNVPKNGSNCTIS